jgi:putative DNA primase/helicase
VILASKQESNADQASPSIRKLAGARCAISSESNDGQRLDIAVVKRHTGGGSLTARGLHENPITFRISHKLWLMTNHIPRLDHMDDAIRARLHLIPFDMKWNRPGETNPDPTLPDADKGLMDTFKLEQEGILLWLIQGAVKYHAEGLMPPKEVVAFTQSYIASQDLLSRFLSECDPCPVEEGATAGILYARYEEYCRYEGERPQLGSTGSMGRRLKALGHIGKKYRDGVHYALRVKEI